MTRPDSDLPACGPPLLMSPPEHTLSDGPSHLDGLNAISKALAAVGWDEVDDTMHCYESQVRVEFRSPDGHNYETTVSRVT